MIDLVYGDLRQGVDIKAAKSYSCCHTPSGEKGREREREGARERERGRERE